MIERLLFLVDKFGLTVGMNVSGKDKSKTRLGGLCSLLFYGFLLWALITSSKDLFAKTNPSSVTSQSINPNPSPIMISPETFPIAFQIQASRLLNFETYINKSIYTLKVYLEITENTVLADGSYDQVVTRKEIVTEQCTNEHFGSAMGSQYELLFAQPVNCIAFDQPELDKIELAGGFDTALSKIIIAEMHMCDSSTSSTCADNDTMQLYLSGGYVNILYNGIAVDPNNYSNPNTGFQDYYYTMISPVNYHEVWIGVGHIEIITDSGWLTDNIKTLDFSATQKTSEGMISTPHPDKILASVAIQLSTSEVYHYRTYKKVQDVLAEIGGLTDFVLLILLIVISPYLKIKFNESIMNELFSVRIASKNNVSHSEKSNTKITKNTQPSPKKIRLVSKDDTSFIQQNPDMTNLAILPNDQTLDAPGTPKHKGFWDLFLENTNTDTKLEDRNYKTIFRNKTSDVKVNKEVELQARNKENKDDLAHSSSIVQTVPLSTNEPGLPLGKVKEIDMTEITGKEQELENCSEIKIVEEHINDLKNEEVNEDLEAAQVEKAEAVEQKDVSQLQLSLDNEKIDGLKKKDKGKKKKKTKQKADKSPSKEKNKMDLGFAEYLFSFVSRSKPLKHKMAILDQGTKEIDMRLDINYIMKRLMDIDKLLTLILDKNQLMLFDNLPKPELNVKTLDDNSAEKSFSMILLRSTTMRKKEMSHEEKVQEAYRIIQDKEEKTGIDQKLLEIFNGKNNPNPKILC